MSNRKIPKVLVCENIESVGLEMLKNHTEVTELTASDSLKIESLLAEFDALIANPDLEISAEMLAKAEQLKVIGYTSSTAGKLDQAAAQKLGVHIITTPELNSVSVAELAFGMLLVLARNLHQKDQVHKPGVRLSGKTLGLVGYDAAAKQIAVRAQAFGMRVLAATKLANVEINQSSEIEAVELRTLLQEADFISLHENIKDDGPLIGEAELFMMRPGSFLVNCATPNFVDIEAAIKRLDGGSLAGLGIDSPVNHPKIFSTESIGGSTSEAIQEASIQIAEQIIDILENNEPGALLPLAVVPMDKIMPHESIDQKRVDKLKGRLEDMGLLANPPIVTPLEDRYMVLDGATRTAAMKQLGFPHAVVQITTEEQGLGLHTWYHVIQNIGTKELKELLDNLPDISLEPVDADQAADRMFEYGALCYMHFGNGSAYLVQPAVGVNRLDALNLLTETYIEAAYVDRTLESDLARLKSEYLDVTALVVFPEYTVGQVMQVTLSGRYFPAGITRFIIPGRILRVNADLEILKTTSMSLTEKNRWLRRHLEEKVQGNHVRFYRESIYLLDE
ncbi:MAG: NAD(P)-dependent oxidoreductase [Chloroflexota bacterium]